MAQREELAGEFIRASFLHQLSSRSVKSLHTAGPSVPLEMIQKTGDHSHRLVLLVSSSSKGLMGIEIMFNSEPSDEILTMFQGQIFIFYCHDFAVPDWSFNFVNLMFSLHPRDDWWWCGD